MFIKSICNVLDSALPEIIWRHKWSEYKDKFGMPYSRGTMANYDSAKTGPEKGLEAGKIFYLKKGFLEWLDQQ